MGQNSQFSFISWGELSAQLGQKLNDPDGIFWEDLERKAYLTESLRFWNICTAYWPQDYTFTITPPFNEDPTFNGWQSTSGTGSPRVRTLTETDLYSVLCYHLMEPQPIAGVWQGTNQFTMEDLQTAAQQNRDEILQATACNMAVLTEINITPGTNRIYLPDTTLDVLRIRYTGAVSGIDTVLVKGDSNSFMRFSPGYRQSTGTPGRYDVLGSPPLALTFDKAPNEPNTLEILVMQAGNTLNPTDPQPLQIPNDWLPVLKWGCLFDLLSKDAESTDHERANYAEKRYQESLKAVMSGPWMLNGFVNDQAVDAVPVIGKDRFSLNWQTNPNAWPSLVVGGIDLISPAPLPPFGSDPIAVSLSLIGNAPIPVADGDFVQAPRDVIDALLDYAQQLAAWKQGGDEGFESESQYQSFISYAMETNGRLRESGIFATDLRPSTSRQELAEPRTELKA